MKRGGEIATKQASVRSADGVEISYEVAGTGEPAVILIHGGLADRSVWDRQTPLARRFRLVKLDLAGHGASGANRSVWSLSALGQDVVTVVEQANLRRVVVVGSSMGGPVALEAARLLAGRVVAVIGVDTFHDVEKKPDPEAWRAYVEGFRADFGNACARLAASLFHPDADPGLVEAIRARVCAASPRVTIALLTGFSGYEMAGALAAVHVPVRAIQGDLFPTNIAANRLHHDDFDAVVFSRVGHFPMLERPDEFNRTLERLIDELLDAPARGEAVKEP